MAADDWRTISLTEYGTAPIDHLTAAQLDWLERQAPALTVDYRRDGPRLTAGDRVGTLLGAGLRVQIRPKVPLTNLFYMLTYAYDVPQLRDQIEDIARADALFDFVVTIFRRNVEQLVRQGIYRAYLSNPEDQPYLRGRLHLAAQVRRPAVHMRFAQTINDLTADVRENQILQHTLWRLSRVPALGKQHAALRRALGAFDLVTPRHIVPADCDDILYHRLNQRYHMPIRLARLLLDALSVESGAGQTPFATFLLPMAFVFERFIGRYLRAALPAAWSVSLQESIAIDADGHQKGIPDIILRRDGRPQVIIDTKYKTWDGQPNAADRDQQFMYCRVLGVAHAVLLYPQPLPAPYVSRLADGVTLHALGLDLGSDLAAIQNAAARLVAQLPS